MNIDWNSDTIRAALLGLWMEGTLRENKTLGPVCTLLQEAGWISVGSRYREYRLRESKRDQMGTWLSRVWPEWTETWMALEKAGLKPSAQSLLDLRRKPVTGLPEYLHHKTFQAIFGRHSKSGQAAVTAETAVRTIQTVDDVLRFRPSHNFHLAGSGGARVDCNTLAEIFGEVVMPERSFLRHRWLPAGTLPKAILTIENLGSYIDLPKVNDVLLIFLPGNNDRLAVQFIESFPENVPWHHFGDLDPKGVEIFGRLRAGAKKPQWFVPEFWDEYFENYALPKHQDWPDSRATEASPPLVMRLVKAGKWLEQEPLIADPRLADAVSYLARARAE